LSIQGNYSSPLAYLAVKEEGDWTRRKRYMYKSADTENNRVSISETIIGVRGGNICKLASRDYMPCRNDHCKRI
jgi:hypothetical protein